MTSTAIDGNPAMAAPRINRIDMERPWVWLKAGFHDLTRMPGVSITYGLFFAVLGFLQVALIWFFDIFYVVMPLAASFLLLGPVLATGLYETSRRREQGEPVTLAVAFGAWRRNPIQIMLMGLALMLFMFAWMRLALLIFMLFFSQNPPRPEVMFIVDVFFSAESLPFLAVGTSIGAILAGLVFAMSVVAIPLLLDRPEANVMTAMGTSMRTVAENFWPLMLWAWLIVLFIGAGLMVAFIGLAVTMPIIGHASWHAYKDLVAWKQTSAPS